MAKLPTIPLIIALTFAAGSSAGGIVVWQLAQASQKAPHHVSRLRSATLTVPAEDAASNPERASSAPADDTTVPAEQSRPEASQPRTDDADAIATDGSSVDDETGDTVEAADTADGDASGQSLAESLARLERDYQRMLVRTARLELEVEKAKSDQVERQKLDLERERLAIETEREELAARTAERERMAVRERSDGAEPTAQQRYEASLAQNTPPSDPSPSSSFVQANNTMVLYSPVIVPYVVPTQGQRQRQVASRQNQLSIQQQRALFSPITSMSQTLDTPRSPWAPIDMTGHHNPWGSGALP